MSIDFTGILTSSIMIVGVSEKIKELLKLPKGPLLNLLPLGLASIISVGTTQPFELRTVIFNIVAYFAVSALFYDKLVKLADQKLDTIGATNTPTA